MVEENYCEICNLRYSNYSGLWKHNKKYHLNSSEKIPKKYPCCQCNNEFNSRHTKWKHEQNCKLKKKSLEQKIDEISEKLQIIEQKPNNVTNITNTTNIQYVINAPTSSSIAHLTFEHQKNILNKGITFWSSSGLLFCNNI